MKTGGLHWHWPGSCMWQWHKTKANDSIEHLLINKKLRMGTTRKTKQRTSVMWVKLIVNRSLLFWWFFIDQEEGEPRARASHLDDQEATETGWPRPDFDISWNLCVNLLVHLPSPLLLSSFVFPSNGNVHLSKSWVFALHSSCTALAKMLKLQQPSITF